MASTSVLATVKAAVVAGVDAATTGVTCSYGPPAQLDRKAFYFTGASLHHELPVMRAGRAPREETVDVRWAIVAGNPGQAGQAAETAALAILAELENVCANDPTLSNVVSWIRLADLEAGVDQNGEGWDGVITGTLQYEARLT